MNKILVVCTGNICRSPMAEALLETALGSPEISVSSAGTHARDGLPAQPPAVEVMAARGIDISMHRSRPLTAHIADAADLILVMEQAHAEHIQRHLPEAAAKTRLLSDFYDESAGIDVPDPYGGTTADYERCARMIRQYLEGVVRYVKQLHGR